MRFGNRAFRTWLDTIRSNVDAELTIIIKAGNEEFDNYENAISEIKYYLMDSFGSYERIDYGTGHELNFYVFLYCLCKIGVYHYADYEALINKIF